MGRISQRQIKGNIYGQWTVISNELKRYTNRAIYYNVVCNCGRKGWRSASLLENGRTKACKSCCKTANNENTFIISYLNKVKRRSKISNFEFDIDAKYIENLLIVQNRKCALSGLDIYLRPNYIRNEQTASLDRIDNTKGYIKGNVQWLHKDINNMKHTFNEEYFIKLCKFVTSKCG